MRYEFGGLIQGGAYFRNFTVNKNRAKVCFISVRCNLVDYLFLNVSQCGASRESNFTLVRISKEHTGITVV